ncbi:MAG TPA: hypothetical protein VJR89_00210 [Polyangiales bacterium]|nr:hypothetical protein [Polyangiales bacterium]
MHEPTSPNARPRPRQLLRDAWHKYGLIVIGNVVFFALLYFVQYRPNSRESRAAELLTLAQHEETEHRLEAAESLYSMIMTDYADDRPAVVAKERLPKVRNALRQRREVQPPLPAACAPALDVQVLLEQKPSFYLAELVAGQYPNTPAPQRERYFSVLDGYVWLALNRDHVPLAKFSNSPTFRAAELRARYLTPKATARFVADWYYDNLKVRNDGFFTLHNAVFEVTVNQAGNTERASVRVTELAPEAEVDVLEFHIKKHAGTVYLQGNVVADEGKLDWQQRL